MDTELRQAYNRVARHMLVMYGVSMDSIEITNTPGYWRDREPRMPHPSQPLYWYHDKEPFRWTYCYFDPPRVRGRFSSTVKTWRQIARAEAATDGDTIKGE